MRLPSRWNLSTLLARSVLVLVLLFAQHQAATHWLSHTAESLAKHGDSSVPKHGDSSVAKHGGSSPAEHCDECLALGALGTANTSAALTLPVCGAHHALMALPPAACTPAALSLAYRSRAPPTLS